VNTLHRTSLKELRVAIRLKPSFIFI
jgi:hypothetical protein